MSITFAPKVVEFPITYKTCETCVQVQVMTHVHIHAASYEMLASTNVHYYVIIYVTVYAEIKHKSAKLILNMRLDGKNGTVCRSYVF